MTASKVGEKTIRRSLICRSLPIWHEAILDKFRTPVVIWPRPWLWEKLASCITHRPLTKYHVSPRKRKKWGKADGRTYIESGFISSSLSRHDIKMSWGTLTSLLGNVTGNSKITDWAIVRINLLYQPIVEYQTVKFQNGPPRFNGGNWRKTECSRTDEWTDALTFVRT